MPSRPRFSFTAPLWRTPGGGGAWYFLTVPFDVTDEIDEVAGLRGGFGSIRVEVTIGESTWQTSLFPSRPLEALILPVKKSVRVAEGLDEGSEVDVRLDLLG